MRWDSKYPRMFMVFQNISIPKVLNMLNPENNLYRLKAQKAPKTVQSVMLKFVQ